MSVDKLIRMANQISSFFRSYPEDQAIKGIHDHLIAFWTPGMRLTLAAYAGQEGEDKLDPLAVNALLSLPTGKSPH